MPPLAKLDRAVAVDGTLSMLKQGWACNRVGLLVRKGWQVGSPKSDFVNDEVDVHQYFDCNKNINVENNPDDAVSRIASAIGEPARTRILYSLVDGHTRTSTELSVVAEVSPSTTSVHLDRLKAANLVNVSVQGKHRLYSLAGSDVARALEGLSILAGRPCKQFVPNAPARLRVARTCYDHMAGTLGVLLHDRLRSLGWLSTTSKGTAYDVTHQGAKALETLEIEVTAIRALRRRFACACLDWSERRPHLGGALGAALLKIALKKKWVVQDLDSRALEITSIGRRELLSLFGVQI